MNFLPSSPLALTPASKCALALKLTQQSSTDPIAMFLNLVFYLKQHTQNELLSSQYKINKIIGIFHIKYLKSGYILCLRHISAQMLNFQWLK